MQSTNVLKIEFTVLIRGLSRFGTARKIPVYTIKYLTYKDEEKIIRVQRDRPVEHCRRDHRMRKWSM